jgi:hypothetical protein
MNLAPTSYNLNAAAGAIEDLVTVFVDNLIPAIEDCEDMYGVPAELVVDLRESDVLRRRLSRALIGRLLTSGDVILEPTKLSAP